MREPIEVLREKLAEVADSLEESDRRLLEDTASDFAKLVQEGWNAKTPEEEERVKRRMGYVTAQIKLQYAGSLAIVAKVWKSALEEWLDQAGDLAGRFAKAALEKVL